MVPGSAPFFTISGPLFVPPPYGTVRGDVFFRGFKTLIRDLGGDYRKVLDLHDIDPGAAEDPDYPMNCIRASAMLGYCSRRFKDNLFGLHLADYQDPEVYGCITTFARTAPTLRVAIEGMVEFVPILHSPGADVEFVTTNRTAEFRWRPYAEFGSDELSVSHGLLQCFKLLATLGGRDFQLSYVNAVSDISRKNLACMEDRFGCKVHAKASANALGFPVEYLDRPLKTSNRILFGLLKSYLSQVKNATNPNLVGRIEAYVRNELSSGRCSLGQCAAKLDTTVRTLHRRLNQRGLKFSRIVEQQRCIAAKHVLTETDSSLGEIANSLGYSEQSSFGRAFKRWTNMTPQAYRDSRIIVSSATLAQFYHDHRRHQIHAA